MLLIKRIPVELLVLFLLTALVVIKLSSTKKQTSSDLGNKMRVLRPRKVLYPGSKAQTNHIPSLTPLLT